LLTLENHVHTHLSQGLEAQMSKHTEMYLNWEKIIRKSLLHVSKLLSTRNFIKQNLYIHVPQDVLSMLK